MTQITTAQRIRGCLLGGALGDALGAGIEFLSLDQIRARYGEAGVAGLTEAYGVLGPITDDTQMTLFTCEGLLIARRAGADSVVGGTARHVWEAHRRWRDTQGIRVSVARPPAARRPDLGLLGEPVLYATRAPGNACMSGLGSARMGTFGNPANPGSKGCGTTMRSAPFGIAFDPGDAYRIAAECATQTHGHPTAWDAAGAMASLVSDLVGGATLLAAISATLGTLLARERSLETRAILRRAIEAAEASPLGPTHAQVAKLGQGWTAEEALAIAVYCAMACRGNVTAGLLASVNHSGDSDSTGAICGQLLGAAHGIDALPRDWLTRLEGYDLVSRVADDLVTEFADPRG